MVSTFIGFILFLIVLHWVADFVFQTHWQATNKSSNWNALSRHVLVYTLTIFIGVELYAENILNEDYTRIWKTIAAWAALNGVLHFITDAITSRINSYLWRKGDVHNFFVGVGFDQVIHYFCLILTFFWMIG